MLDGWRGDTPEDSTLAEQWASSAGAEGTLDALRKIAEEVHAGDTVDAVMNNLVQAVIAHGPWPKTWIAIFDESHRATLRTYQAGYARETLESWLEWPLENSPSERTVRTGKPVMVEDFSTYADYDFMSKQVPDDPVRSALYVPVPFERLRGVVSVNRPHPHVFSSAELALLRIIASFVSLAFRSVRMRDEAIETERATSAELLRLNQTVVQQNNDLQRMASVHQRLLRVQIQDSGLDQVCAEVSDLLAAPIVVLDRFHQVASSAGLVLDEAEALAELYAQDLERVRSKPVREFGAGHLVDTGGVELREIGSHRLLIGRAVDHNNVVGTVLAIWDQDQVDQAEARIMEQGCLHVTLDVLRRRAEIAAEMRSQQDFATALLDNDNPELIRRATLLGLRVDVPVQILSARVLGIGDGVPSRDASELAALTERRLRAAGLDAVVTPIAGFDFVVALMLTTNPELGPSIEVAAAQSIRTALRDGVVSAFSVSRNGVAVSIGIGAAGTGSRALRASYDESLRALDVLQMLGKSDENLAIADAGTYSLLSATATDQRRTFVERYLQPLLDYDGEHSSSLADTLRTYFAVVGNVQRTAEVMFLHISTVRYRLGRIEKITGMSLRDQEHRFCLQMALRLAEMDSGPFHSISDRTD